MNRITQHPGLDLERWIREYPLPEDCRQGEHVPWYPLVCNPESIAAHEQIRRAVAKKHSLGLGTPVDLFLWGLGAPSLPYLTKIGGVPHREAGKPWPNWIDGTAYTFLFQICFVDSLDLLPRKLPGDVLLCFQLRENFEDPDEDFFFEWSDMALEKPLAAKQCPRPAFTTPQLHGVIHRTVEYPESSEAFEAFGCFRPQDYAATRSTKIGSVGAGEVLSLEGDLFCAFSAVKPGQGAWPFVDCASLPGGYKYDGTIQSGPYQLIMGDLGSLIFLSRPDGSVYMFDQLT